MRVCLIGIASVVAVSFAGPADGATVPGAPGCRVLPSTNPWNRDVSRLPVAANSAALVASIGLDRPLHPDFSNAGGYGIPFNIVRGSQPKVRVSFLYGGESDRGPYPLPSSPRIERGSDRHLIVIDRDRCKLYELFDARRVGIRWRAGSGAIFDLRSNALRPRGWTSADAAGLPIFPGLARYAEVRTGRIDHALRFTAPRTGRAFVFPARHHAGISNDPNLPPMGLRVRLKASVSLAGFRPQSRIVLTALKRYGMVLADNGSPWYVTGAPSSSWDDDDLHDLHRIRGTDFEVVDPAAIRP